MRKIYRQCAKLLSCDPYSFETKIPLNLLKYTRNHHLTLSKQHLCGLSFQKATRNTNTRKNLETYIALLKPDSNEKGLRKTSSFQKFLKKRVIKSKSSFYFRVEINALRGRLYTRWERNSKRFVDENNFFFSIAASFDTAFHLCFLCFWIFWY